MYIYIYICIYDGALTYSGGAGSPRVPGVPECHARTPGVLMWRSCVAFWRSCVAFWSAIPECLMAFLRGVLAFLRGVLKRYITITTITNSLLIMIIVSTIISFLFTALP